MEIKVDRGRTEIERAKASSEGFGGEEEDRQSASARRLNEREECVTDSVPWMFDNLHFVESNLGRPKHGRRSAKD